MIELATDMCINTRHQMRRLTPLPLASPSAAASVLSSCHNLTNGNQEDEDEIALARINARMELWFAGKCQLDHSWCQ